MRLKFILVFCGLMTFVCSSFSNESFLNYINRYERIEEYPYTLRCMPNKDQLKDIGMTELESIFGFIPESQSFDADVYDSDKSLDEISVSAYMIGYFTPGKYIVVLSTIMTDAGENFHAKIYAFVFTKNGDLIDRLLVGDGYALESKYLYPILVDETHISTFDYLEDFSDYESLKSSYYVETIDYELKNDGKSKKGSSKRIDLENDLKHYLVCPIPEDDPMFRDSE